MSFDFDPHEVYENRCIRSHTPDAEVIADLSTDLPQSFYIDTPVEKKPVRIKRGSELKWLREYIRVPSLVSTKRGSRSDSHEEPRTVFDFDDDYQISGTARSRILDCLVRLVKQRHDHRLAQWRKANQSRPDAAERFWKALKSPQIPIDPDCDFFDQSDRDRAPTLFERTPPKDERLLPWLSPDYQGKGTDLDAALDGMLTSGTFDWINKGSLQWMVESGRMNQTELDRMCSDYDIPEKEPQRMALYLKPTLLWRSKTDPIRGAAWCLMDHKFDFSNEADVLDNIPQSMPRRRLFKNNPIVVLGRGQFYSGEPSMLAPDDWTPEQVYACVESRIKELVDYKKAKAAE